MFACSNTFNFHLPGLKFHPEILSAVNAVAASVNLGKIQMMMKLLLVAFVAVAFFGCV